MTYVSPLTSNGASLDVDLYRKVMLWLMAGLGTAVAGVFLIGPLIPTSWMLPLSLLAIGALLVAAFSRKLSAALAAPFAIIIPLILGVTLYPVLNNFLGRGAGDIIVAAGVGTVVVFGGMAVLGWTSSKSLDSWGPKLFVILLGVIAVSLLNIFLLQLSILSLLISMATLVIFSIYTFIDIQAIRNSRDNHPSTAPLLALNVFLDIFNIFVSLLNIFSFFDD